MCLGVPGKILSIHDSDRNPLTRTGTVEFGGIRKEINLAYTPGAREGDHVIVHVGFAISVIDEVEAHRVFETLDLLELTDEIPG